LDKLTDQCEEMAGKWDARSKHRVGELTAMASALEILKGDATSKYGANKLALASKQRKLALIQGRKKSRSAFSFLQVDSQDTPGAKKRLLTHLKKQASLLGSSSLATLVLALQDSPFDSVKKMIEDLITKIDDEQASEDSEIEDCKNDIVDATKKIAKNGARIEEEEATIVEETAAAGEHIEFAGELGKEVTALFKELNEATELRAKEEKENKATIADATAGKESMDKAIKVLKEFYDSDFEKGLIQISRRTKKEKEDPDAPGGFLGDDPDEDPSKQDDAKGIFGLLGTIKSDYESTLETVKQEEKDSEKNYNDFKKATEKDISDKQQMKKDEEGNNKKSLTAVEQAKEDLVQWTDQKAGSQKELNVLTPRCLGLGASAEERKKRREEEKKALQDAITIIETMAPADPQEFLQIRK